MSIRKAINTPVLTLFLALSGCNPLCALLPSTCGPTDFGVSGREQEIYSVRWSPDGKKLAFTYQNGYLSNFNFSLYTVNSDGSQLKKLFESNTKNLVYNLYQWAPNNDMLTGNRWHLFEIGINGKSRNIINLKEDTRDSIDNSCTFPNSDNFLSISGSKYPFIINISKKESNIREHLEIRNPILVDGSVYFLTDQDGLNSQYISCRNDQIFININHYLKESNSYKSIYAIASINQKESTLYDFNVFKTFDYKPGNVSVNFNFRFFGWNSETTVLYTLSEIRDSHPVFEYNLSTRETKERQDIKVIGEFSPDFQKVAFPDYDGQSKVTYLAISNPDGTHKQRILKAEDLPKGSLPE